MEYRDLELQLFKYTEGWNMNEGSFPIESKSDLENAEAILSKRYSKVDKHHLDMQRKEIDGTDYKIEFSEPYLEEERIRRELTFLPELDPEIAKEGPIGSGLGQGGLAEAMNDSSVFRMFLEDYNDNTLINEEQSPDVIEDVHDEVVIDALPELEEVGDDEFGLDYVLDDYLEESIEKHDELNPDLFENETLRPEVKEKIEEIVQHFKDNLKEDEIELDIKDILLVGSNASFNYTDNSDIDVHIVADTSVYEDKADLAAKVYDAYKRLFNQKYDPMIRGHEVEIYVDPNENHAKSNGIYSLNTGWVKEPENSEIPEVNQEEVDAAVKPYEERAEQVKTLGEIDKLIDDIYVVRQQGILEDGEYSLGNLTFKEFRNRGYLEKLKDMKIELENKEMSLESLNEDNNSLKERFLSYCEDKTYEDLGEVDGYEVIMIGNIKDYKNVKVVNDEDSYESLIGYVNDKRVIESPMIDSTTYALRMEFDKIKRDFVDMIIKYWDDLSFEEGLTEGKFDAFAKKLAKKADDAAFEKTTKTQVNFSDYEKEISEIMDQYDDVIDAAHAALEYLVYDAQDKYAIRLASTDQGYNNLMTYLERIAKYEGVGERQHKADVADFKSKVDDIIYEPTDESLVEEANELAQTNAKRFAKFLEETSPDFEDGIDIERFPDHYSIVVIGYDADGSEDEFKADFMNDGEVVTTLYLNGERKPQETYKSYNDFIRWVNKEGSKLFFDAADLAKDYYDTDVDNFDKFQSKLNALDELELEEDVESDEKELALSNYLETEVNDLGHNVYEDVGAGIEYLVLTAEEAYDEAVNEIKSLYDDLGLDAFSPNFVKDFGSDPALFNEEEINDAIDAEIDYLEDTSPDVADNLRNASFEERVDYLVGLYGEDLLEELYDINKIAEMVVEMDGVANSLAHYDGNEIDLGNGLFAYRLN